VVRQLFQFKLPMLLGQYERAVLVWDGLSGLYLAGDGWARTNLPVLHEKVKPKLDYLATGLQVKVIYGTVDPAIIAMLV
jgi:hypothetical protein